MLNANVLWKRGVVSQYLGTQSDRRADGDARFWDLGNDPRKEYALEPYYQFGEPRTVGATISYRFGE